jgi:3-deoxy-D-manno-octulosonic-acid transferase
MAGPAFLLYQALACLAALGGILYMVLFRPRELRERLGGGGISQRPGCVWIHAASLGEFEAARPLIRAWGSGAGAARLLVSCANPIARRWIAQRLPEGARVRLAPLDIWPCVARALARERPSCLVFLETEIWPAWILAAACRSIPVAFASARLSDRTYPRYRRIRFLLRPLLGKVCAIGCRTEEDRRRWVAIGAPGERCTVWGNTKYDASQPARLAIHRGEGDPFVLAAGSIRTGEEAILDIAPGTCDGGIRWILAPRHLREIPRWEVACVRRGLSFRRLGDLGIQIDGPSERAARALRAGVGDRMPAVVIVDRMGVLLSCYRAADAAFVGGTWVPIGGHNLFEPAREGVPVIFGSSIEGVRDVGEALIAHGGGILVSDANALGSALARLCADPMERAGMGAAARRAAEALSGAAERTIEGLRGAGIPPQGLP